MRSWRTWELVAAAGMLGALRAGMGVSGVRPAIGYCR